MMTNNEEIKILPFKRYMSEIKNEEVVATLKAEMCCNGGFSASSMTAYLHGYRRPDMLKRREIAKILQRHSGDKSITAESLFPSEFYEK